MLKNPSDRETPPPSTIAVERGGSLRFPQIGKSPVGSRVAGALALAVIVIAGLQVVASVSYEAARLTAAFALGVTGVVMVVTSLPARWWKSPEPDAATRYRFQIATPDDTAGPGSPLKGEPLARHWLRRMMDVAQTVAGWSKDPTTPVGAVLITDDRRIVATGYNGLPQGVEDRPERMERPDKYLWTSHAEANAIANAARHGAKLEGTTCVVTHFPCASCARSLIGAGVKRVVAGGGITSMPAEEFKVARSMFDEAGVELLFLPEQK